MIKRHPIIAVGLVCAALLAVTAWIAQTPHFGHWLQVHAGVVNEPGPYYGFWSGFGSDVGEVTIIGALLGSYRVHNCEVHRCWRLGRHATSAGHRVCRRHHPDDQLTHADVLAAHERSDNGPDR